MCFHKRRLRRGNNYEQCNQVWKNYSVFGYQWEGNHHFAPGVESTWVPTPDGTLDEAAFSWVTAPTLEQELMIAAGCSEFPPTPSYNRLSSEVLHSLQQQEDGSYQISNHQSHLLSGFINIQLVRGNKQTHKEVLEILYGKCTFVFDTKSPHASSVLDDEPYSIPGLPRMDQDGNRQLPSDPEIPNAI